MSRCRGQCGGTYSDGAHPRDPRCDNTVKACREVCKLLSQWRRYPPTQGTYSLQLCMSKLAPGHNVQSLTITRETSFSL